MMMNGLFSKLAFWVMSHFANAVLLLEYTSRLQSDSNRQPSALETPALPLSYGAAPQDGFEPSLPSLEEGRQPSDFLGMSAGTRMCAWLLSQRVRAHRYLCFPCGSGSGHHHLLTQKRQGATQPSSLGSGFHHDSGQFITDIGFEVERHTQSSRRGTGGDFFQGAEIRNGHQHDEVRDFHPSPADQGVGLAEFECGVRGLRCLQSERQIGTSHDVQPVKLWGRAVLQLQGSVLLVGVPVDRVRSEHYSISPACQEFATRNVRLTAIRSEPCP